MSTSTVFPGKYASTIVAIAFAVCCVVYGILSLIFFDAYPMAEIIPDMVSYLNIARKYSEGHVVEALNAYWSPLLSWLIVPFYWIGVDPFVAFRIVNLITGLVFLFLILKIINRWELSAGAKVAALCTFSIFSFFYQVTSSTADFISVFFGLVYLYYITDSKRTSDRYYFVKVALSAALAFFSKSYFFAFCCVHIFLVFLFDWFYNKEYRKQILKNTTKVYVLFFLLSGIWILVLSAKYDKFVISSSGSYNFSLLNPERVINYKKHYHTNGLLPLPDKYSVSHWDDPTYYPIKSRNPFESKESLLFQWNIVKYNWEILGYLFRWFSYLGWFLIVLLLYVPVLSRKPAKSEVTIFIFSAFLYLAGYLLIFYEDRYTLPAYAMLIVSAFYAADDIVQRFITNPLLQFLLVVTFALVFLKNPIVNIKEMEEERKALNIYKDAALKLTNAQWLQGKKIASRNGYEISALVAFYNRAYSFGYFDESATDEENVASLNKYDIDFLFYYNCWRPHVVKECDEPLPQYLRNKKVVYQDNNLGLRVFEWK